jgi:uncharacterized protein YbjT (DUF2867 family)
MARILLTGATGKISTAIIEAMRGSGHELVGVVRNPSAGHKLGIEVRGGDLEKPRSLEGAFGGVDTAFLLGPPGALAPYQMSNALWAARQAGVKHVVRMSAIGAAHDAPTLNGRLHALSDTEVAASGVPYTILKPHFFMQNLLMSARSVAEQGTLVLALGDAKLPMIDVADIAASAAAILRQPAAHAGQTYTLTGREAVSMAQVAAALSEALGVPVRYQAVPVAAAVEHMASFGADDFMQVAMRDYFTAYSAGWASPVTDAVERLTGRAPRTIAEFARAVAPAFR